MWDLWHFGHRADMIRPYGLISRKDDIELNKGKKSFTAASKCMETMWILIQATDPPLLIEDVEVNVQTLTRRQSDVLVPQVLRALVENVYIGGKKCGRIENLTCATLYENINIWRKNGSPRPDHEVLVTL